MGSGIMQNYRVSYISNDWVHFLKVFLWKKIDPIWRKISNEKPVLWCFQKLFFFIIWADIALAKKVISLQKKQKSNETKSKEKENLAK